MLLRRIAVVLSAALVSVASAKGSKADIPCLWKSLTGAEFDLRTLTKSGEQQAYFMRDGDIPCTPEVEPTFSYLWNFCAPVTAASYPTSVCDTKTQQGAALQYVVRKDYKECNVIGHYDSTRDDIYYTLLDASNPALGVSMRYPDGDLCPSNKQRSVTLDVKCANVELEVESALEPTTCDYHIVMKSYRGCPTSCPVTASGLCSSHGHCSFDQSSRSSYCYCNEGYTGDGCEKKVSKKESYDGYSVQLGLLIVLLIAAVGLIAATVLMVQRVQQYRREQVAEYYSLPHRSQEMVDASMHSF